MFTIYDVAGCSCLYHCFPHQTILILQEALFHVVFESLNALHARDAMIPCTWTVILTAVHSQTSIRTVDNPAVDIVPRRCAQEPAWG